MLTLLLSFVLLAPLPQVRAETLPVPRKSEADLVFHLAVGEATLIYLDGKRLSVAEYKKLDPASYDIEDLRASEGTLGFLALRKKKGR